MRRALLVLLLLSACTRGKLVPAPEPDPARQDDRVRVEGEFLTTDPDELNFPVKIMFVVDRSQSMNVSDPNDDRVRAQVEAIDALIDQLGIEFSVVGFGLSTTPETERCEDYGPPRVNCQPGFTTDRDEAVSGAIRTGNPGAGNTDFGAALSTAYTILFRDMSNLSEEDAGNARYVVIFLSDGLADVDSSSTDRGQSVNDIIDDIVELKKRFRLRDLTFHTALLSAGINRQDIHDAARAVLSGMARRGGGVFRDFENGGDINFLAFDSTSYRRLFTLKNLIVTNFNAHPGEDEDTTDSDGDGLTDTLEFTIGSDPTLRDTDGDFFSDLLEHRLRTSGLDPLDPSDADCGLDVDQQDADGDGLRDCEERFLGTRPKLFDTDFDGVPDWVEVWADTLSTVDDLSQDLDFDGSLNGDEIRWHANPRRNDSGNLSALGYRYVQKNEGLENGQFRYTFRVDNIRLASTMEVDGEREGRNRLLIYITEVPMDDPGGVAIYRIGCATARFIADADVKDPPNGIIKLTQDDLHAPTDFNPAEHCRGR